MKRGGYKLGLFAFSANELSHNNVMVSSKVKSFCNHTLCVAISYFITLYK
jgi:hypothetical protein